MTKLDLTGVEFEISQKALKKAIIGDTADLINEVLGGLTDGNIDWLADALVERGQMADRVLLKMSGGNWNYAANKLWTPNGALQSSILQWLRNNPTTGIH